MNRATETAAARIARARSVLIMDQPFFGVLASGLRVERADECETMATDGRHLFYADSFVAGLSDAELRGVVAHEVMHCALGHFARRDNRDMRQWNVACDLAINPELIKSGFVLPAGALNESRFHGMAAEDIFAALRHESKSPQPQSGAGKPGTGNAGDKSGAGGQDAQSDANAPGKPGSGSTGTGPASNRDPGKCGGIIDAAPGHDPAAAADIAADWKAKVRQAIAVAKAQNAGTVPGGLERVNTETGQARVDWRAVLRRFIDESSTRDYSFMRPNRRAIGRGLILPGHVATALRHLVVAVDVSGSIDPVALAAFEAEINAALAEDAADRVTVVYCDTRVRKAETFDAGEVVTFRTMGGGGTAFAPAFAWIEENAPDASAIVYFTDLLCSAWGEEPAAPVLWAAWGNPATIERQSAKAPFGEVLSVAE